MKRFIRKIPGLGKFGAAPASISLTNASANGTLGLPNDNAGAVATAHGLLVIATTNVTGGVVTLMGSMDGQNWFPTASKITLTTGGISYVNLADSPFRFVAAKITTVISGGTVSAWVASSG